MSQGLSAHIVSHTHWDREWYHTAGRFRQRLVALIDELLDDPPPAGSSFLLDGQAIVLEDYLAVRPERASELASLLREGRLEAGPWYVLADELIPGGEALVRNLLAGRRVLGALRAQAPPVLYCPDSFGHPAALPELARGFGYRTIVLWRGYGGRRWPSGDTVHWRAPSGRRALLYHLPPSGYEYGSQLPTSPAEARGRWDLIRRELGERSAVGVVLVPHGADHHARQAAWRHAITALENAAPPDTARASSLTEFVRDLEARAHDAQLPEIHGELRDSYGYTWTLQGTFATRAYQKRRNAIIERRLLREVEPWRALAQLRGLGSRRALVDAAWRSLLQCHPHDTLCGCSIDEVARAMDARLDDALSQADGLLEDAVATLIGHDASRARERTLEWQSTVIVRNPAPRSRGGVAIIELSAKVRDVAVGPGSSVAAEESHARHSWGLGSAPHQLLAAGARYERIESPWHYPDNDLIETTTVAAWIPDLPAYGIRCIPLDADVKPEPITEYPRVGGDDDGIHSGPLRLVAHQHGRLALSSPGRQIDALIGLEAMIDRGDLYTSSLRGRGGTPRFASGQVSQTGPLRSVLHQRWMLEANDGAPLGDLLLTFTLDAGAPFLRIGVRGENGADDLRLRIVVFTGVRDAAVWADAAFGVVARPPIVVPPEDSRNETPLRTAPLHRYVSLFGSDGGATVYSDGLGEYEVMPDGGVAITLVRAVGELSRNDLPERPGHAGWPAPTPEAQCHGAYEAELALLLHGGARDAETIDLIERTADDVLLPLTGATLRAAIDVHDSAGFVLDGCGLAMSCAKEAANGEAVILRCVNLLDTPVLGAWRLPSMIREATLARLDETPLEALEVNDGIIAFEALPRAVVTVLVR